VDGSIANVFLDTLPRKQYSQLCTLLIVKPQEQQLSTGDQYHQCEECIAFIGKTNNPSTDMKPCPEGPHGFAMFFDEENTPISGKFDLDGKMHLHDEASVQAFFQKVDALELPRDPGKTQKDLLEGVVRAGDFRTKCKQTTVLRGNICALDIPFDLADRLHRVVNRNPKSPTQLVTAWGMATVQKNTKNATRDFRDQPNSYHHFNNEHPECIHGINYRYLGDPQLFRRDAANFFSPLSKTPRNTLESQGVEGEQTLHDLSTP
jgi:hypothetical protein